MIYTLIEKIKQIDCQLFCFVQEHLKNPFFDISMPIITDFGNWTWLLIIGLLALFIFGGRKGKTVSIVLIITILFADNLSSFILKPFFGRLRPNDLTSFSFPSNHATNIFAMAMVLGWYYRKFSPIFFTIACIVGFSRVYIGVHYLGDVLGGALLGIICALFFIWCTKIITKHFSKYTEIKSKTG